MWLAWGAPPHRWNITQKERWEMFERNAALGAVAGCCLLTTTVSAQEKAADSSAIARELSNPATSLASLTNKLE